MEPMGRVRVDSARLRVFGPVRPVHQGSKNLL